MARSCNEISQFMGSGLVSKDISVETSISETVV